MGTHAANPPEHILGYPIRSRTHIIISYLIPAALELFVYFTQITADCAVSYEHFHSHQPNFGGATLALVFVPPVMTFILVMSSKSQWDNPRYASGCHFVSYQLLQMLLFPFFVIYRFMVRIFWSVEALFHDNDDTERMLCLARAMECSTCELYHLIQAYGQSAPQIILQLYHMLTQNLFRNFQTTTAQAICLVFSAINIAAVTTTYQRFESQRQVGRHIPWATPQEEDAQNRILDQDRCLREECERKARYSQRTIASFPESDKIMANFNRNISIQSTLPPSPEVRFSSAQTYHIEVHGFDEVDDDVASSADVSTETTVLLHNNNNNNNNTNQSEKISRPCNATDDEKVCTIPRLRLTSIREELRNIDEIEILDTVPDSPAPLPPPIAQQYATLAPLTPTAETPEMRRRSSFNSDQNSTRKKRTSKSMSQLEVFKDMLIVNAQLYIKEHVPRPPKLLISRVDQDDIDKETLLKNRTSKALSPTTPVTPQDVVDFFLPRPTKVVNGIQQDDFAGKTIAFFGWIAYITMRMLSLATFCIFYSEAFFILVSIHYLIMLAALFLESRQLGNLNRIVFYLMLAFVYIFVLVEFDVRFKRIRLWLIGYFILTMGENIGMTAMWYINAEFESWWFGFIFEVIIYSGILFMATLLVYYCILRPKDVTLILEDDEANKNKRHTLV